MNNEEAAAYGPIKTYKVTVDAMRKALAGLPGNYVTMPSSIWTLLIKDESGKAVGYIAEDGYRRFDPPKEEKPCKPTRKRGKKSKDTSVQVTDSATAPKGSCNTAEIPVPNADGCPQAGEQYATPVANPGSPTAT